MDGPETPVTVNWLRLVPLLIVALVMVQLPLLPVTQLAVPPGAKLPLTVALATAAHGVVPGAGSPTVTVAVARQPFLKLLALPLIDQTAAL